MAVAAFQIAAFTKSCNSQTFNNGKRYNNVVDHLFLTLYFTRPCAAGAAYGIVLPSRLARLLDTNTKAYGLPTVSTSIRIDDTSSIWIFVVSVRADSVRIEESDEEQIVVVACLLAEEEELEKKVKKRKHSIWIHDIFKKRSEHGEYHTLFPDLSNDDTKFFQYFRMSQAKFNYLFDILKPHLLR
ncbi:hypothetical protein MSG28_013602 [Choristoneura fumiferana]|uniref:Uncharacterized protein n=1 Tax=Choristoneura fumiferana TaxID=7141 RepID=A0ACC0K9B5_CHOFU|nr:hypothetical protein MSG28_013602 [Choristoneura fumiferana]